MKCLKSALKVRIFVNLNNPLDIEMNMKISLSSHNPLNFKTQLLGIFVEEDNKKYSSLGIASSQLPKEVKLAINDMRGEFGKISVIHNTNGKSIQRFLVAGIGKKEKTNQDTIRFVSGKIAQKARELKLEEFTIIAPSKFVIKLDDCVQQIVEGSKLSLYKFEEYKSKKETKTPNMTIITPKKDSLDIILKTAQIISDGVIYTRSIANLPPNVCNPSLLANFSKKLASKNKMRCKIISKKDLIRKGFGGISAVGQGSRNEPKLIILEHKGGSNEKPIVIVGKAVTFDTGGISIKPGEKMDEMKFDKCGGCTVLGIMKVVSELKLPINLVGIIPSVENMPGGESYRPGDIIKLYNGKSAEILNTDAEGRLILADALAYGEKHYSPRIIMDFATLTGACIIALGTNVAGMISNNENLVEGIKDSSKRTTEEVWQLPLNDDYMDMIKSEVADMKNMGIGRAAGTITASAFLRNAIKDTPWIHFDIAGVAWTQLATKDKPYNPKGATGFGVRLILDYLKNL